MINRCIFKSKYFENGKFQAKLIKFHHHSLNKWDVYKKRKRNTTKKSNSTTNNTQFKVLYNIQQLPSKLPSNHFQACNRVFP